MDEHNCQHQNADAEQSPEGRSALQIPQSPPEEAVAHEQQGRAAGNTKVMTTYEQSSRRIQMFIALITTIYAILAGLQWYAMNESLKLTATSVDATKRATDVAEKTLTLSQRPWISVTPEIAKPLTFDEAGKASIQLSETLENIGQSVAVDVLSWADIIPLDPNMGYQTAHARQQEFCDRNRHRDPQAIPGYVLFPKQQHPQGSVGMAATTEMVEKAKSVAPSWAGGKIGFAIVGCVFYRASFEPPEVPRHQTRFMYYLGRPGEGGSANILIEPAGVPPGVRLVLMPAGNEAD